MTIFETGIRYNSRYEAGGESEDQMYELYIDVLFLINLTMDVLLMHMVRQMTRAKTSGVRILLGSGIGALGACLMVVFPVLPRGMELLISIALGGLMVKTGLCTKGIQELFRGVLCLIFAAVTMGGLMFVLYQYTPTGYYAEQLIRGDRVEGIPLLIWIFLGAGSWFFGRYLWILALEIKKRQTHLCHVVLCCGETQGTFTGFLDTGNQLHEPVTGQPVHVVSKAVWQTFYRAGDPVCLIPYHTISREEGFMPGRFLDLMRIENGQEIREIQRPLIAVSPHPVSQDESYEILLNEEN